MSRARTAGEGDTRAFEELVQRHEPKVLANCRYMSGSSADAEDLTQEVFVKAFFALKRFEGRSTFKTWLQRIKVNHTLNHLRKRSDRSFVDVDQVSEEDPQKLAVQPMAERHAASRNKRERIDVVLDSMAETLRLPLVLREVDQLSYQEIADALGLGLSAVKMRIKRGREEFRRLYAELTGEDGTGEFQ